MVSQFLSKDWNLLLIIYEVIELYNPLEFALDDIMVNSGLSCIGGQNGVITVMACFRTYSIILACDSKGGIGRANAIPWQLKEDMAFFRKLTIGSDPAVKKNTVIMGRKTYESLPNGPLGHRNNIVILRVSIRKLALEGIVLADSLDAALSLAPTEGDIFAIGGKRIFEEALKDPRCKTVYLTRVDGDYACDVTVSLDLTPYELVSSTRSTLSSTGVGYYMEEWVRG